MYIFGGAMTKFGGVTYAFGGGKDKNGAVMDVLSAVMDGFSGAMYPDGGGKTSFGGNATIFGGSTLVFPRSQPVNGGMPTRKESPAGTLAIKNALRGIANFSRWRMLRELASGEAREIGELAAAGRSSLESASKHMRVLREAGVVVMRRGRLYSLAPSVRVNPEKREIDLGFLLARFDHLEEGR